MNSFCPQCESRLTGFSVVCGKCGWTLLGSTPEPGEELDRVFHHVMNLIEQEDFGSALSCLNQAFIDVSPDRLGECYSLRGHIHLKNLDFEDAESDCTEAINRGVTNPQTYAWRAAARGEKNKWRMAFDDLDCARRLASKAGDNPDLYHDLMDSYSSAASKYFRSLIKQGNESAELFFERGWIYFRSDNDDKAVRDFGHALTLDPQHPGASMGLARIRIQQGNMDGVMELCAVAAHGDAECEATAIRIQAQIHRDEGNSIELERVLDRLSELSSDDPKSIVECCQFQTRMGNPIPSIKRINQVLKSTPDFPAAYRVRGDCYRDLKNHGLAIKDYSCYLRLCPDDPETLAQRASLLVTTECFPLAREDISSLLEHEQTRGEGYLLQSRILLLEGRLESSLSACEKSVRLLGQSLEAFAALAEIHVRLGDFKKSVHCFGRCIALSILDADKAEYLLQRGIVYFKNKDFPQALDDFNESSRLRPHHGDSWVWKAAASSRLEDSTDAVSSLGRAMETRAADSTSYRALDQSLGTPIAEAAIRFFDRQQQGKNVIDSIHPLRGLAFQFMGRTADAIDEYTQFLKQSSGDATMLIRRGQALASQRGHDAAVADFSRVIANDSTNHVAFYCRALSLFSQQDYSEAQSDADRAIELDPRLPRYHVLIAALHKQAGNFTRSIDAYDAALALDASDSATLCKRGTVHLQSRNYVEAIRDFTHSIERDSQQSNVHVLRGQAYQKLDQLNLALEDFEIALTRDPHLASAYSGRAAVLSSQGKFEYVLIWLTKAIHRFSETGDLAEVVFARGNTYFQMGRLLPAIADFTAVIELVRIHKNRSALARTIRAIAYGQLGLWGKSKKDFERVAKLDPENLVVLEALAWLRDPQSPQPRFLVSREDVNRPTRPPVVRTGVPLDESNDRWSVAPPFDTWVIRTQEKKEFGPVHYEVLKKWIDEGRLDLGMKVLRADWSKWRRAEKIFSELEPVQRQSVPFEEFPGIRVN